MSANKPSQMYPPWRPWRNVFYFFCKKFASVWETFTLNLSDLYWRRNRGTIFNAMGFFIVYLCSKVAVAKALAVSFIYKNTKINFFIHPLFKINTIWKENTLLSKVKNDVLYYTVIRLPLVNITSAKPQILFVQSKTNFTVIALHTGMYCKVIDWLKAVGTLRVALSFWQ